MIANDFISAKDLCTYSMKILRQEKTLRDHRSERPSSVTQGISESRLNVARSGQQKDANGANNKADHTRQMSPVGIREHQQPRARYQPGHGCRAPDAHPSPCR
jgi:hypothetical protein